MYNLHASQTYTTNSLSGDTCHIQKRGGGGGGVRKRQAWVFICKSTHVSSFYTSRWHIRWCKWYITSSAVVNIRHVVACMAHNVKFVITSLFCFYPSQFQPPPPPPPPFIIFNFYPYPVSLSCFQVPEARSQQKKWHLLLLRFLQQHNYISNMTIIQSSRYTCSSKSKQSANTTQKVLLFCLFFAF